MHCNVCLLIVCVCFRVRVLRSQNMVHTAPKYKFSNFVGSLCNKRVVDFLGLITSTTSKLRSSSSSIILLYANAHDEIMARDRVRVWTSIPLQHFSILIDSFFLHSLRMSPLPSLLSLSLSFHPSLDLDQNHHHHTNPKSSVRHQASGISRPQTNERRINK